MHFNPTLYVDALPQFPGFNIPTDTMQPVLHFDSLLQPMDQIYGMPANIDYASPIFAYDRISCRETIFSSVRNLSSQAIAETHTQPTGISLDHSQRHIDPSPLSSSSMTSYPSILEARMGRFDSDEPSMPLVKMFDPLLDPRRTRQEVVQSYMAEKKSTLDTQDPHRNTKIRL